MATNYARRTREVTSRTVRTKTTLNQKKRFSSNSERKIQQDATMYLTFIIPYLYEAQHVSGDTPPIIRSLKLHWQPLVFYTWKGVGRVVGGRCQTHCAWQRPTTFHIWKTRGCQCSFRILMMGGVSPETCWASYKYGIIKVWYIVSTCWICICELCYDARIHKHKFFPAIWT
jgi:hypothetical protein